MREVEHQVGRECLTLDFCEVLVLVTWMLLMDKLYIILPTSYW